MSEGDMAIVAEKVAKTFRSGRIEAQVLKSVDFRAAPGQLTMIMGPSGSGKSTLLGIISGLLQPDSGSVTALGTDIWTLRAAQLDQFRLRNAGFVFQGFNLSPALRALQQVTIVLRACGMDRREADARAEAALDSVGLSGRLRHKPSELSGGEKQRVAIARALAKEPRLIFADEPTSALDSENGQRVIRLLKQAAEKRGASVICVTHDPRLEPHADRVILMEDGAVVPRSRTVGEVAS